MLNFVFVPICPLSVIMKHGNTFLMIQHVQMVAPETTVWLYLFNSVHCLVSNSNYSIQSITYNLYPCFTVLLPFSSEQTLILQVDCKSRIFNMLGKLQVQLHFKKKLLVLAILLLLSTFKWPVVSSYSRISHTPPLNFWECCAQCDFHLTFLSSKSQPTLQKQRKVKGSLSWSPTTGWVKMKYQNTKIMISQRCANICCTKSAHWFRTQLCKSVLLCAAFTWNTPHWWKCKLQDLTTNFATVQ